MLSQLTTTPADHNHHRYRRNSYTKSIDNGPTPAEYGPDGPELKPELPVSRSLGAERGLEEWTAADGRDRLPEMSPPKSQNQGPMHRTTVQVNSSNSRTTSSSQKSSQRHVPLSELSSEPAPEVVRWLQTQGNETPAQDCNDDPRMAGYLNNNNNNNSFNIATAIDPTYHRRQKQPDEGQYSIPQVKSTVHLSRSLPAADGLIEWEPGVRGSLRRLKGTLNPLMSTQDTPTSVDGDSSFDEGSMNGAMQPVQGQKRSTMDNRARGKARKSSLEGAKGGKNSSSCKQQ